MISPLLRLDALRKKTHLTHTIQITSNPRDAGVTSWHAEQNLDDTMPKKKCDGCSDLMPTGGGR